MIYQNIGGNFIVSNYRAKSSSIKFTLYVNIVSQVLYQDTLDKYHFFPTLKIISISIRLLKYLFQISWKSLGLINFRNNMLH